MERMFNVLYSNILIDWSRRESSCTRGVVTGHQLLFFLLSCAGWGRWSKGGSERTVEFSLPAAACYNQRHREDTPGTAGTHGVITLQTLSAQRSRTLSFSCFQCLSRDASGKILLQYMGTSVRLHATDGWWWHRLSVWRCLGRPVQITASHLSLDAWRDQLKPLHPKRICS